MSSATQASLLLHKQLRDLMKNPVDGFSAGLVDDSNIFEWSVTIIGPPDTLYDGGYFNAIMTFPANYPNSPPTVKFISEMWHPNVYPDGRVCISILHAPGDDPNGYELASERWTPVHTRLKCLGVFGAHAEVTVSKYLLQVSVLWSSWPACLERTLSITILFVDGLVAWILLVVSRFNGDKGLTGCNGRLKSVVVSRDVYEGLNGSHNGYLGRSLNLEVVLDFVDGLDLNDNIENGVESIVLSIISMLSSPNDESPANVEAAKEWRDRRDDFKKKVSRCVRRSQEML
ncbi:hypothetical protein IFM89_008820 [Coptis chinensis]|uniref:UBC core domain-containing protein n=1 Tax=Coptis chinensis TaxID=261450 RepID=A0A835HBK0_9MAGN|nr:hypothetical protein IFM89_008820 [Coptis chinensis]